MESDLLQTSTNNTACRLILSRALCAVCGAPAIGRNFDAMTCLSCKAFFRRNAYNEHLTFTCRLSSSCLITPTTRRHCSACRLKKCFQQGMKKELIRSLSAINHATSAAITANLSQRQTMTSTTMNFLSQNSRLYLSTNDWTLFTNIRNAYEQYCIQKFIESHETIPLIPPVQPYRSRIKLQRLIDLKYKYIIIIASFIKRILQFDIFPYSLENYYTYIKDNFHCLLSVNTSELMKSKILEHFPWEHDQLAVKSVLSEEIIPRMEKIINTFQTILPYDPLIMKLFIIILALSSRITPLMEKTEYNSGDFDPVPKYLLQSQNYYLILLWKYVIYRLVNEHNELDYIDVKYIPSILHNDNVYLTILYKCSSLFQRRISLSIYIDRTLYRTNVAVFRRHWFCQKSTHIKIRYVRVYLHRSLAYASDIQSNLQSWPIEQGQLKVIMYKNKQENENEILKKIEYNVKFLPVHKRPNYRSFRWNPLINKTMENICSKEPEVIRIINYPLVLTGSAFGKHFVLPSYQDYSLRLEQQIRLTRPKFSILFWLYIDEYCIYESITRQCAILQHLTFNNTRLTPEIFLNQEGQIIVNMYGYLYDLRGTSARTIASIPKKDWCRVAFIVNEYTWNLYVNCLRTWDEPIKAIQNSPIYYYFSDEFGTFIVGGSEWITSFRGFISQMDIYRRIAFTYEQLPKKFNMLNFPSIIQESNECKRYLHSFKQCQEQSDLFNKRIQEKFTCDAQPFLSNKLNQQCRLIHTWKKELLSTSMDVRYRIFRALRQHKINSTIDIANKLYDLTIKLLENDDFDLSCNRIITWSEQAVCYGHASAHSLLATFYQYGLCGLQSNSTRALELLLSGVLHNDRISLLALGHRHFYGLDGIPLDYDTAYVYYQQMAFTSRHELYNPIPGEVAMDYIRLTDNKLLNELTFEKSDIFYWLTQQAKRGVASAQHRLGALMYEGRNGLTRNIQAAVEYFRLGADQHDASSHFGYGLSLLKGQGVKQNVTEGIRHIEKAVEHGYLGAQVALGYYAYEIEKNYTKAAQLWQECFDRTYDANCAHNLGVLWTLGHHPPNFIIDHLQAWRYYSFAAQHGQIDSKVTVAFYNARGGHPAIIRNSWIAAIWSRNVAEQSSVVGTIVRRALQAYQDRRWHTSFIFYIQAALAGIELGYFNSGYLCKEFDNKNSLNCIEQFLNMYLMIHGDNINTDSYALLNVAEYYQWKINNLTKAIQLYVELYRNGDPQGLYSLAQIEEESNNTIPLHIWTQIGVNFDEKILTDRYRRLQTIYQYCRMLKTSKSDESYIPCTVAYLRISIMILFNEQFKIMITIILMILSTFFFTIRR